MSLIRRLFFGLVAVLFIFSWVGAGKEITYRPFGGYLNLAGKGSYILGSRVIFGGGLANQSILIAGSGGNSARSILLPDRYLLGYNTADLFFFPGVGFVKTDMGAFFLRDRSRERLSLGGEVDISATILTTALQFNLRRLPTGFIESGIGNSALITAKDSFRYEEPFFTLARHGEGYTAYLSLLYKFYPESAVKISYLGNFPGNCINNLWVNWIKPEILSGSLSLGLGIENGDAVTAKGAYGVLEYAYLYKDVLAFEGSVRLGNLQYGERLRFYPAFLPHLKIIYDDGKNEAIFALGFSMSKQTLSQINSGELLSFRFQYRSKGNFPFSAEITKINPHHLGIGVSYDF